MIPDDLDQPGRALIWEACAVLGTGGGLSLTGVFPIIDVALLRVDVVVETEDVRGRVEESVFKAGLTAAEGVLGAVDDDWPALPGDLLAIDIALLLTEAVVEDDGVRSLDGPASGVAVLVALAADTVGTMGFEVAVAVVPFVE